MRLERPGSEGGGGSFLATRARRGTPSGFPALGVGFSHLVKGPETPSGFPALEVGFSHIVSCASPETAPSPSVPAFQDALRPSALPSACPSMACTARERPEG